MSDALRVLPLPDGVETSPERSAEILGVGYDACRSFASLLLTHGEERGLIGPREIERLWTRHVLNSAAVLPSLPESGTVADVGSGAGLPGIVIAACRPDLEVHLIEPMDRRVQWLGSVAETLGLSNVSILRGQAQEFHDAWDFDAVTARAVAALDKLVRITWPLVRPGGCLVAMKGARAHQEVDAAAGVLRKARAGEVRVQEMDLLGDGDVTRIVTVPRRA
ncbi:16S rRNA (guanine(527)-N(7))-methyltransferase RsmG [Serinibacter salmoneus]|uniref:Ribosomal RNA small subunit methyltransferase G n=1 Tax=Serinibacter salmoneus TaxID=556530 RepID=A0A2A9D4H4_9MICO|nr:16S rRNA (guanine(527)-N(7))-methyltransferase RsmG [Serinibacter salmoneus]PFG21155.1 16S rRNA m(7)G-527 methyltransferase [Serinibacter salmoneus]